MRRTSKTYPVIHSAAFTAIFLLIGWRELNPLAFPDLEVYRVGFESGWYYFSTLHLGPLEYIFREVAWVRIFEAVYTILGNIDAAFTVISIISIFAMGMFVCWRTQSPWYLVLFVNPAFIQLSIEQIRSGLAAGIFWTAVAVRPFYLKLALIALAASVHTVFFIFGPLYLLYEYIARRPVGERILANAPVSTMLVVAAALLTTLVRDLALASLGDSRAFADLDYTSGVLLALAWTTFFGTYVLFKSERRMSFEGLIYAFGAFAAFGSAVAGQYGSRFVAITIPALAVMCHQIDPRFRLVFIAQYGVFTALYFRYWLV